MKHYKPEYAKQFPAKISVKRKTGEIVVRSVRWGNFLPDWIDCADSSALVPYVVVDNQPLIICSEEKSGARSFYLVSLSAYLNSYGVQLLTAGSHKGRNWWREIA